MTEDTGKLIKQFTIRITDDSGGDSMNLTETVDAETVSLVISAIYGARQEHTGANRHAATFERTNPEVYDSPQMSLAEYLDDANPGNNFERIAAVALYHREVLGQARVPRDDIPKWFQRAGRAVPKNLSRDIRYALKRGLIAEDHAEADKYYVTRKGEELLRSSE